MFKRFLVVGAVVLALVAGAGVAFAATSAAQAEYCGLGVGRMLGGQNLMTEVQEATGLSWEDLRAARLDGKSFAELLQEKGMDLKAFIDQVVASRKAQVDELVAAGKITSEQADLAMKNFQANIEDNLNNEAVGRGCGVGQGFGGRGMGGRGARWQNQNSQPRGPATR